MVASSMAPIRLTVPGTLRYRDVAVRIVAEAARLVSCSSQRSPNDPLDHDVRDPFDTAVVSAFMEIFNNVAIHAYQRKGGGSIEIAITPGERYQTLPFVRPGGDILLKMEGWPKVERVLQIVDAIEAIGIDPAEVSAHHWRHVHNRLTAGEEPRRYTVEQHRALLLRRRVDP